MSGIFDWIKEHPLPAALGGIVLFIIVYVVTRGSSGSSAATSYIPVQTGPSDAVQEASIAASVQQASINAASAQQANQLQGQYNLGVLQLQSDAQNTLVAAQATNLQTNDSEAIALAQLQTQQSIANTGVEAQVNVADTAASTQADINQQNQKTQQIQIQTSAQTAAQQLASETSMYNTGANLQASLAQTAASVINNQTSATLQTNLAGIGEQNNANNLNAGIETTAINDQTNLNSQYLTEQSTLATTAQANNQSVLQYEENAISSGVFNKGGAGGANQVAAFESVVTGASQNPYPTATASVSGGNSPGGIINSISGLFSTIGRGITGGLNP